MIKQLFLQMHGFDSLFTVGFHLLCHIPSSMSALVLLSGPSISGKWQSVPGEKDPKNTQDTSLNAALQRPMHDTQTHCDVCSLAIRMVFFCVDVCFNVAVLWPVDISWRVVCKTKPQVEWNGGNKTGDPDFFA